MRILFVGNSYLYFGLDSDQSVSTTGYFLRIAEAAGDVVESGSSFIGGSSLEDHWFDTTGVTARQQIETGDFDLVIVVGYGLGEPNFDLYADLFSDLAQQNGSDIGFFVPWPQDYRISYSGGNNNAAVAEAHVDAAVRNGGLTIPIADAYLEAYRQLTEQYGNGDDGQTAETLLTFDVVHPTPLTAYLAGCVMYMSIFGKRPPAPIEFLPPELTAAEAEFAWAIAIEAADTNTLFTFGETVTATAESLASHDSIRIDPLDDGPVGLVLDGGGTLDLSDELGVIAVALATGDATATVTTGGGNDTVIGGSAAQDLRSGDGDDVVTLGAGGRADLGAGNDTATGSGDADTVIGGTGDDSIALFSGDPLLDASGDDSADGGDGKDSILSGAGDDDLDGGAGDDLIAAGGGANSVWGGDGNDSITCGDGPNGIDGGSGDDLIETGGGADTVRAGTGNDTVTSADGTDSLDGGSGDDLIAVQAFRSATVAGGAGSDTVTLAGQLADYAFAGTVTAFVIRDATAGADPEAPKIDLKGVEYLAFADGIPLEVALLGLAPNQPPVVQTVTLPDLSEDQQLVITAADLLQGANDPEGLELAVQDLMASSGAIESNGDGTWTYTPTQDDNTGVVFGFAVSDGTVSVAGSAVLDLTPVNDAPVLAGPVQIAEGTEDTSQVITLQDLLANASDIEGDALSITGLAADRGLLQETGAGVWTYLPDPDASGAVLVTYLVSDGAAASEQFAHLTIAAVNDAPVAASDVATAIKNQSAIIAAASLLANDRDIDSAGLTITEVIGGQNGTAVLNDDQTITFTPDPDFRGQASFLYRASDGALASDPVEVIITLLPDGVVITGTAGNDIIGPTRSPAGQPRPGNGADTLLGNGGNDRLDGGAGLDLAYGGAGNDSYTVDSSDDQAIETLADGVSDAGGTDGVTAFASFVLAAFVENLVLGGAGDIDGTGNSLGNRMTGNAGANVLAGLDGNDVLIGDGGNDTLAGEGGNDRLDGGAGDDVLSGGAGNDTYTVAEAGDLVTETRHDGNDAGGNDQVNAAVSFTLGAFVEKLTLTGAAAIDGEGNAAANQIVGNAAANTLDGGAAADRLTGNAGEDLLLGGEGNDTLTAGDGDDTLSGGTGDDNLAAGAGADLFLFDEAPGAALGLDRVTDFNVQLDRIGFDQALFDALVAGDDGVLVEGQLHIGTIAVNADDRLIYNPANGRMYYDADGAEGAAQVEVAALSTGLAITEGNILIL